MNNQTSAAFSPDSGAQNVKKVSRLGVTLKTLKTAEINQPLKQRIFMKTLTFEKKERLECVSSALDATSSCEEALMRYCEYPLINNLLQKCLDLKAELEWAKKKVENEGL